MHKYLYIVGAEKPFSETELVRIKDEICKLFKCTQISVSGGTRFTIQSPLGPGEVEPVVSELSKRFRAQFSAGGKVD
jgi:hypothetical protein